MTEHCLPLVTHISHFLRIVWDCICKIPKELEFYLMDKRYAEKAGLSNPDKKWLSVASEKYLSFEILRYLSLGKYLKGLIFLD